MNKFTCPGFVFCPYNTHTKGNTYHTICCGENGIIYDWDIVDRRSYPSPMGRTGLDTRPNMNMVDIMLLLLRLLWSTGKTLITYSGFYIIKALL